jgi:hypothetical protein
MPLQRLTSWTAYAARTGRRCTTSGIIHDNRPRATTPGSRALTSANHKPADRTQRSLTIRAAISTLLLAGLISAVCLLSPGVGGSAPVREAGTFGFRDGVLALSESRGLSASDKSGPGSGRKDLRERHVGSFT